MNNLISNNYILLFTFVQMTPEKKRDIEKALSEIEDLTQKCIWIAKKDIHFQIGLYIEDLIKKVNELGEVVKDKDTKQTT